MAITSGEEANHELVNRPNAIYSKAILPALWRF